jgi:thioredoxin 1
MLNIALRIKHLLTRWAALYFILGGCQVWQSGYNCGITPYGKGDKMANYDESKKAPAGDGQLLVVTDADFERVVLGANVPVMVDLWAAWCRPCLMVAPTVKELAHEFAGQALIAKLDVDVNSITPQRYGVRGIPTLLYFHNGQEVDRVVGVQSAHVLRQKLEALL